MKVLNRDYTDWLILIARYNLSSIGFHYLANSQILNINEQRLFLQ